MLRSHLYEARIADLKEAHEARVRELMRTIEVLAEQVEYLRAVGGIPQPFVRPPGVNMAPLQPGETPRFAPTQYMSEEEEDVRAMADGGLLDAFELESALAELGIDRT